MDCRIINPGMIHLNDIRERWIRLNSQPLTPQLVVHAIMDLIEPLDEGGLGFESCCQGILLIVFGQTVATEFTR